MRRATGAEGVSANGRCASPGSTRRSTRTPTDTDRTWGRRLARRTKSDPSRRSWSPCSLEAGRAFLSASSVLQGFDVVARAKLGLGITGCRCT
jgi:hypothetical protein